METQNITLTLPKTVLRRVKILAAPKHTSVSSLLTETLEALIAQETGMPSRWRVDSAAQIVGDLGQWAVHTPKVDDILPARPTNF